MLIINAIWVDCELLLEIFGLMQTMFISIMWDDCALLLVQFGLMLKVRFKCVTDVAMAESFWKDPM